MAIKNFTRLILLCSLMSLLYSCDKKDSVTSDDLPSDTDGFGYMASAKDMRLTYTLTEGDGLGHSYLWHVTDVKDSSDYKVASSELVFDGPMVVYTQGKYNREKTVSLGSNMPPLYYQLLEKMKEQFNTSFVHKERSIITVIPHNDPLNATVSGETKAAEWHGVGTDGDAEMKQDYEVKRSEAIIDSLDHIKIGLGEFDCLRIRYTQNAHNKIVITDKYTGTQTIESDFKSDITVWVALGIGLIKSTEVSPAGISTTELTKIEK